MTDQATRADTDKTLTWEDVEEEFPTWEDVEDAFETWGDLETNNRRVKDED